MLLRLISDLLDSAGWSMDDADELRTADNRLQRECLMLQDVERRTLLGGIASYVNEDTTQSRIP